MDDRLFRKGLAVGIIVLFIGTNFVSGLNIQLKNTTIPLITGRGYIQDLIDNASDGDMIYIPSGTYYENIIINKSINLVGEDKNNTIIDGGWNGDVVTISADWVNISGFTIQNTGVNRYDAGIKIFSNHTLIMDNIISNNRCGIYLDDYCDNNKITGNNINSNNEEGIFLDYYSDNNIITGNNISNNDYGILFRYYSGKNIITGNNINSNNHDGIWLWGSSGNSITDNNISDSLNGIYLIYSSSNSITDNNITSNYHDGICLWGSSGNRITSNKIISNNEYGIYIMGDNNKIEGNNISLNKKYGIYLSGDQYNLYSSNSILKNNFICNRRHAYFDTAFRTQWSKNYWEGVISPHVRIYGMRSFYILDITGYNIIWELRFPWFNFDWYPAKEPYDI